MLFSGCLGKNQGEVRAMPPSHTGTFEQPYAQLVACAKAYVETDSWAFGEPIVQSTHETAQPLIRLTASYLGSALFEVSFQPIPAVMTLVEYRHGYDGYDTQEQTWAIIERCAHQLAPPKYRVPSLPHKAS
jgi:pyocin large subunit-like protein